MKPALILYCLLLLSPACVRAQRSATRGRALPLSTLNRPGALAAFLPFGPATQTLLDPSLCEDSSGNRLIALEHQLIYIISTTHTKDDGVLIAGTVTDTTAFNYFQVFNAFLIKTDNRGNVLWLRFFGDGAHHDYSNTEFNLVTELQSGDIVVAGVCFNSESAQIGSELLARYDAGGTLKWYKTYSSSISDNPQYSPVDFRSVTDGKNGDLIVCGTVMNNSGANLSFTTILMTGDGNVIWDVNYHHPGGYGLGSEGLGAKLVGENIVTVGLDHGLSKNHLPVAVEFLTLNYGTGALVKRRLFATDYSDSVQFAAKQFAYFYNHVAFLDNGHMIVYGSLNSDLTRRTALVDHFGIMEFDGGANLVGACTVGSYIHDNSPAATMHFDRTGTGIFMLVSYAGDGVTKSCVGVMKNGQITAQRKKNYWGAVISNSGGYGENARTFLFDDGGFGLAQNYEEKTAGSRSYIDFRIMHLSDTSSECLGTDTLFSQVNPLNVTERAYSPDYVNEVSLNKMTLKHFNLVTQPASRTSYQSDCMQTNYCDTLKIHGDTVFCSGAGPQVFSAFRNVACGAIVQWQLDSNFIASDSVLSDSSISVCFKRKEGFFRIRATLPAGTCTPGLSDSLLIFIRATPQLSLGPDTTLCGGNTIPLNAGAGFSAYLWQDGSGDSLLPVSEPGRYSVSVEDACGNVYRDTIEVTDAASSFSLGNDTFKCNKDTLKLQASNGFTHYSWTPAYNLVSSGSGSALLFPDTTTTYTVRAERGGNCVLTDSVRIGVLHSADVDLGANEALCEGSSLALDAGSGFAGYAWSTGERTENISVSQAGTYVVKATAANGCISQGAKIISGVYSLPHFTLAENGDTTICAGQILQYRFSFVPASYLWSDGTTGAQKSITAPGNYSLTITRDGCPFTDSVQVAFRPLPLVDLGDDIDLCPGQTKMLIPVTNGVDYRWQDGTSSPQFRVTQGGLYQLAVTLDGCSNSDSVRVRYLEQPKMQIPADTLLCDGETIMLHPRLNTPASLVWQDGGTDSVYAIKTGGIYSVTATNGCGSDARSVKVITGLCQLLLPNAFTPNNDGKNDVFKIRYSFPVQSFKMKVFSRWGQLIFESSDMTKGWDGRIGSPDQPEGGYTWSVELFTRNGEHRSATGVLLLIR